MANTAGDDVILETFGEPSAEDEAAYYSQQREEDALWYELGDRVFADLIYGSDIDFMAAHGL